MGRKHKNIDTFACPVEDDNNDISGFSDEPIVKGKCLSSFSFDDFTNNDNEEVNVSKDTHPEEIILREISYTDSTADKKNPDTNTSINTNLINHDSKTNNSKENIITEIFDNRRTPIANGSAPAIDGETPSIRRCYILRESTIRKINELKMMDKDINVCVSTIVDLAIDYYYKTISSSSSNLFSNN